MTSFGLPSYRKPSSWFGICDSLLAFCRRCVAVFVHFSLLLRVLNCITRKNLVYNPGNNSNNDPGNKGWKKKFYILVGIILAIIIIMSINYYEVPNLFELCRPSAVGTKLADFSKNQNVLFMNADGNNPNTPSRSWMQFDPIKDAQRINDLKLQFAHEMRQGYGNDLIGSNFYAQHHSKINNLYACLRDSDVNFKREILTLAKENVENSERFRELNLRSIAALKYINFDSVAKGNVSGLNPQYVSPFNNLSLPQLCLNKSLILDKLQANIDSL